MLLRELVFATVFTSEMQTLLENMTVYTVGLPLPLYTILHTRGQVVQHFCFFIYCKVR